MSNDSFVNIFLTNVSDYFDSKDLEYLKESLNIHVMNYDIREKETDIIVSKYELPQEYKMYLASKIQDGRLSKYSQEQYRMCLEDMLYTIGLPVDEITTNHIRMYLHKIRNSKRTGKPISDNTLNQRKSIIHSFFKWLREEEYIIKDPSERIRRETPKFKPREAFSDTDIEIIRDSCSTIRDRAIVDLLTSTGIRLAECSNINISDVNFDKREIQVFGKGGKWRTVYINGRAIVSLKSYLSQRTDDNEALFVSIKKPYSRLNKSGIEHMLHSLEGRCGIKNVIPHRFRHTFATKALNAGMPIDSIKTILGHSEIDTTLGYAKSSASKIQSDYQKYLG